MRTTWAMLLDAYRELNAKKLFWITMAISALVVVAFACVSTTPKGLKILAWEFENPFFNSILLPNAAFYKLMFQTFGINFWLTWAASIIGLIATCSMIPDFIAGGSIELTLSKPVSRFRLFITKYAAGLVFTFLQVLVFTTAVFLLIGIRGGEWSPRVFLAVPIVTLTYSYLFAMCAFVGMLSRSAIFSLIATIIFWVAIFAADTVESGFMLGLRTQSEVQVERLNKEIAAFEEKPKAEDGTNAGPSDAKEPSKGLIDRAAAMFKPRKAPPSLPKLKGELVVAEKAKERWTRWHRIAFAVKTILPKTRETTNLVSRVILPESQMKGFKDAQLQQAIESQRAFREARNGEGDDDIPAFADVRIASEVERRINQRSVWWVLGTSLGFEALVLALTGWMFSRRDF